MMSRSTYEEHLAALRLTVEILISEPLTDESTDDERAE